MTVSRILQGVVFSVSASSLQASREVRMEKVMMDMVSSVGDIGVYIVDWVEAGGNLGFIEWATIAMPEESLTLSIIPHIGCANLIPHSQDTKSDQGNTENL
jgi:hypothetical protein